MLKGHFILSNSLSKMQDCDKGHTQK